MSDISKHQPYQTLGKHLRYLREQQSQTLAEVSGAVEIDQTKLEHIEAGRERPAEDILLLLISYFDMQDQEAVQLWELAGYDGSATSERHKQEDIIQEALSAQKSVVVVLGVDARTMYTDSMQISADAAGIIMNFGQLNSKKQPQSIARLGMSYEQAEQILKQLQHALLQGKYAGKPKLLPPTTDSSS